MITTELLDQVKVKTDSTSDYALAQALDVSKQKVSDLRSGRNKPDPYTCAKMAEILGRDPLEIIAQVEAENARSEKQRSYWRSFLSGLKRTAHVIVLLVTCGFLDSGLQAGNANADSFPDSHNVYYVK